MQKTTNPHLHPLPRPEGEDDAKRLMRVFRRLALILSPILISQLFGCETANYAPPVTPTMTTTSSKRKDVDPSTSLRTSLAQLERGRTLFVHRCIECHTLPAMWKYSREDWPKIVNDMSHRASLKPQDREAVIAYILEVRAQQ